MKAVVKADESVGATLMDMEVPKIGPKDVLMRVKAVAICGSDARFIRSVPALMARLRLPHIFGHEASGDVVETGELVTSVKKGDRIAIETHIPCGTCYQCQTGAENICRNVGIFGADTEGAFAEYTRVPENCCWKLSPGCSYDMGAVMEPLGVAVHGVMAGEVRGQTVAVFGCGPIGLFALGAASALGASRLFAVEVAPKRLAMARQLAPEATVINPQEQDVVAAITQATDGLGVDVALEVSGSPVALNQALQAIRRGGRVNVIGSQAGPVEIDVYRDVFHKEAKLVGVWGRERWQTWWVVQRLLDRGSINPEAVITHRLPLDDFAKGFDLAMRGEAGKVLFYP